MSQNRHTLKILQNLLQDFQSVSDPFGTLCVKGLKLKLALVNHDYCRKINDIVFVKFKIEAHVVFYTECKAITICTNIS